ncbi:hypothetical protein CANTEDRAFT_116057 [Yamadazyma tenuis ATCC 10573]|uniref:Pal1-domain-containing protein n=1 Tax=Candida tenuis (strain ATCC 10573 / BCRC 21748 / CBS 615 / JCM 9827 / NBRC 10315 / NRRL Y-1498 / VKM Y-70) TaxID=590646 RepID=G3BFK2_CANTC|nr:uncharacterized protein CANTEDRAFT_116057 [Yamadazyma tenuis ATCC 10573]EGV60037.1 hypothetical protein CANTEDRAFT_116057 [Yamadazyma tenuis ATCC 10573]
MYQQPNHSYASAESLRRLSSNNPFRGIPDSASNRVSSTSSGGSSNIVRSPPSRSFESWVEKNKKLIEEDDSIDDDHYNNYLLLDSHVSGSSTRNSSAQSDLAPPQKPRPTRTNSDPSVKMSSNNPFASALNGGYVHYRDAPPPPPGGTQRSNSDDSPSRPPKSTVPPPPSYEEVAGPEGTRREYPREKVPTSSSRSSRPHRSHSDSSQHHRSHRSKEGSGRERSERSERHHSSSRHHTKSSSKRSPSKKSPSKKTVEPVKSKNLDTIDKLDVTGFFGGGFHHDGPFDACTPHRNKDGKLAPVMAFPVDGPNSSIRGGTKFDPNQQLDLAFGNYTDQNEIVGSKFVNKDDQPYIKTNKQSHDITTTLYTPKQTPSVINFDANIKSEPIHGTPTAGLGSTTFVDGAPAPKNDEFLNVNNGGLGRKKSLVQRLRKNSGSDYPKNRSNDELNITHSFDSSEGAGNSLMRRVKSLKVGRRER